jgi:hypothetical protein
MGLGLAATLFALRSVVRLREGKTPLGWACKVEERHGSLAIEPRDGLHRRIILFTETGRGIGLSVDTALIRCAHWDPRSGSIRLDLDRVVTAMDRCAITFYTLPRPAGEPEIRQTVALGPDTTNVEVHGGFKP